MARPERIERMLILLAIVMGLAVLVAFQWRRKHGPKDPQLSTKRRGQALSIFRLGLELIRARGMPPHLHRVPLFVLLEES